MPAIAYIIMELLFICSAALGAGFVDAVVGGGGLIMAPVMFATFPTASSATLLGTNKVAGLAGTAYSTWKYSSRVSLQWSTLLPAAICGFTGALFGAYVATTIDQAILRKLLPFLLIALFLYTLAKKELGQIHRPMYGPDKQAVLASTACFALGFYDGFFGPGTGSLFVFFFVRFLGFDFVNASASAKLLNTATNVAAVSIFALKGHVWWHIALWLGAANVLGGMIGTVFAIKYGAAFIRKVFLCVVCALIAKVAYEGYFFSVK